MEGDSPVTSTGLEWQNLALYTAKPPPMQIFEGSSSRSRDFAYEDMMMRTMQCSSPPDPVAVGLRLGGASTRGLAPSSSSSSIPVSSTPTKRSRASYHNMQNPCCQVQGCNLDLRSAKDYHRRHRICESHSKSPKVIVAGMERRFCQQCSRFHDLSEFDDKKRSCRRRLSDHNARRRRVQPESIQLSSPGISPALYTDQRQQHNVLLNGLPVSMSNSSWENTSTLLHHHALATRPSKTLNDDVLIMDPERLASIHRSTPRILDQCLQHGPSTNSSMAADLLSAHSLLSSNSWSLNEGEESAASMEGMGNYGSPVMRHSEFQTNNNNINGLGLGLELDQFVQSGNLHDAAASSHHQEYHLFKPLNYHSGNFYSTQRTL